MFLQISTSTNCTRPRRNAKKPDTNKPNKQGPVSVWARIPRQTRLAILEDAYKKVASFQCTNSKLPPALFGVVVDAHFRSDWDAIEKEQFAYEVLLNKFDVMLKTLRTREELPNRGLVIHDRRVIAERDIQSWTSEWRATAGKVGQLRNLADVPLFSDSRATRLLQVADLVSYALFRRYRPGAEDAAYFKILWPLFHADAGAVHGCVHYSPSYGQGSCSCEPCTTRLDTESRQLFLRKARISDRPGDEEHHVRALDRSE